MSSWKLLNVELGVVGKKGFSPEQPTQKTLAPYLGVKLISCAVF